MEHHSPEAVTALQHLCTPCHRLFSIEYTKAVAGKRVGVSHKHQVKLVSLTWNTIASIATLVAPRVSVLGRVLSSDASIATVN